MKSLPDLVPHSIPPPPPIIGTPRTLSIDPLLTLPQLVQQYQFTPILPTPSPTSLERSVRVSKVGDPIDSILCFPINIPTEVDSSDTSAHLIQPQRPPRASLRGRPLPVLLGNKGASLLKGQITPSSSETPPQLRIGACHPMI